MRLVSQDALSDGTQRMWAAMFPTADAGEMTARTEEDRLFAAAVVLADDYRHMPQTGLAQASADERFLFARIFVRTLRAVETGGTHDDR